LPSTIEQAYREHKDRKFTVLAIDIQEDQKKVEAWVKEKGFTPPVLLDRDGTVSSAYRISATPTAVLIGRDGKMVARGVGTRPWTGGYGKALLDAMLAAP
jgi:peroxiredoxin